MIGERGHRYEVQANDAITFDSRLAHRYVNDSDRPARLLVSVTPPMP